MQASPIWFGQENGCTFKMKILSTGCPIKLSRGLSVRQKAAPYMHSENYLMIDEEIKFELFCLLASQYQRSETK